MEETVQSTQQQTEVSPSSPNPSAIEPVKPPSNFFVLLLKFILILVILSTAVLTVYFGYQNYQLRSQIKEKQTNQLGQVENVPSTDNLTTSWKVYTNYLLGFELETPPDWEIINTNDATDSNWESGLNLLTFYSPDSSVTSDKIVIEGTAFTIFIYHKTDYDLTDIIDSVGEDIEKTNYSSDYVNGILVRDNRKLPIYKNSNLKVLIVEKNSNILAIMVIWPLDHPENEKVIDQILSTFKFTDEQTMTITPSL